MKGHPSARRLGRGGILGERCPGTQGESRPNVPRPIRCPRLAVFKAWSHRGPWTGPVG